MRRTRPRCCCLLRFSQLPDTRLSEPAPSYVKAPAAPVAAASTLPPSPRSLILPALPRPRTASSAHTVLVVRPPNLLDRVSPAQHEFLRLGPKLKRHCRFVSRPPRTSISPRLTELAPSYVKASAASVAAAPTLPPSPRSPVLPPLPCPRSTAPFVPRSFAARINAARHERWRRCAHRRRWRPRPVERHGPLASLHSRFSPHCFRPKRAHRLPRRLETLRSTLRRCSQGLQQELQITPLHAQLFSRRFVSEHGRRLRSTPIREKQFFCRARAEH